MSQLVKNNSMTVKPDNSKTEYVKMWSLRWSFFRQVVVSLMYHHEFKHEKNLLNIIHSQTLFLKKGLELMIYFFCL